jgi:redox-sensing transcriptional repressor
VPRRRPKPPESTIRRLSLYLRALEGLSEEGEATASSELLAGRVGTTAAQVRKDLSHFGSFGKRGLGYEVGPLQARLEEILGLRRGWPVVLVGAGRIGSALFEYPHFGARGFEIVAILDRDPAKVGRRWGQVEISSIHELGSVVHEKEVELAILTVPRDGAQEVAEALVSAGVRGILNFAPLQLRLPPEIEVNDVNLALEMEALSFALHLRGSQVDDADARREKG